MLFSGPLVTICLSAMNRELFAYLRMFKVNVSAAVEIVSNLGLWSKFENGKTLTLAEIVKSTQADEIMIGKAFSTR